jgi:hypothetical protein
MYVDTLDKKGTVGSSSFFSFDETINDVCGSETTS